MKTKNEVIEFAKSELSSNNTLVIATLGNGGSGLDLIQNQDEDFINSFVSELNEYKFDGVVEPSEDIEYSDYFNEDSEVYQFSGENGYFLQILGEIEKITYDIHFNDSEKSDSKGFSSSLDYCQNYIECNNGTNESYFEDYKNGTVSIVCNETGETVFETAVL